MIAGNVEFTIFLLAWQLSMYAYANACVCDCVFVCESLQMSSRSTIVIGTSARCIIIVMYLL